MQSHFWEGDGGRKGATGQREDDQMGESAWGGREEPRSGSYGYFAGTDPLALH